MRSRSMQLYVRVAIILEKRRETVFSPVIPRWDDTEKAGNVDWD